MKVDVHPFQGDVEKYIAYLQTTEGRLRLDLAWMNLRNFLPRAGVSILSGTSQALDLGGGTGATALCLAELGFHVTLVDKAEAMLSPAELRDQLHQASLEIIAERGVRVMADYLPGELSQDAAAYERLLAFEQSLGEQPDLAAIARYTQVLARAAGPDRQG